MGVQYDISLLLYSAYADPSFSLFSPNIKTVSLLVVSRDGHTLYSWFVFLVFYHIPIFSLRCSLLLLSALATASWLMFGSFVFFAFDISCFLVFVR